MPTIIKQSGTKVTAKIQAPITRLISSVRSQTISPQKGTQNPPHVHVNVPQSVRPKSGT